MSASGGPGGSVLLDMTLQVEELLLAMRISATLTVLNAKVDLPVSFRAAGADVRVHLEFQNKARRDGASRRRRRRGGDAPSASDDGERPVTREPGFHLTSPAGAVCD